MLQNETEFQPLPKMFKLLEAAINPDVEPNISAWCRKANISRCQWYRWSQESGFLRWFNHEFKRSMASIKPMLLKTGIKKALEGDFQFWKVMMEKTGEYTPTNKIEHENKPVVVISPNEFKQAQIHDEESEAIYVKSNIPLSFSDEKLRTF